MFRKRYRMRASLTLPIGIDECWSFFSDPHNLPIITPAWLGIRVVESDGDRFYPGLMLAYRVAPVFGLPMQWLTEITHVAPPNLFVDEQRIGPYRLWHHVHRFSEADGGVEVEDIVDYVLPFGPLGRIAHALFVRRQVAGIFEHRAAVLKARFGEPSC